MSFYKVYILKLIGLELIDIAFSWERMLIALFISIFLGFAIGVFCARNRKAEEIIIPIVDVLQTLPILAFFPFAIYVFVSLIPGDMGKNAAVIFLIITSMLWNIIFGCYESIKTLNKEYLEVAKIYGLGFFDRVRRIYFPACSDKIAEQAMLSWSIGLFYLVTSEIFSIGSAQYQITYGIGAAIADFFSSNNFEGYATSLLMLVIFVILTYFLLFSTMERKAREYLSAPQKKRRLRPPKRAKRKLTELQENKVTGKGSKSKYFLLLSLPAVLLLLFPRYEVSSLLSILISGVRIWIAFGITSAIALPVSIYVLFFSKKGSLYKVAFQVIASIPATSMLPLIAMLFSSFALKGEATALSIYVLSCIWYVIFSVLSNAKTIPFIREVVKVYKVRGAYAWRKIYLLSVIPGFITGSITGIAAEWNASIVAEYFQSQNGTLISSVGIGVGKLLDQALYSSNILLMAIALINMVVAIIFVNKFLWKSLYERLEGRY
ncbi:MAG: ABC transporter permease subunit [Candidatus Micrarchaeaceae archaeon]